MSDTLERYGRTFRRTAGGGWLEDGAELPKRSKARIHGEAVVMKEAAAYMWDGTFHGGTFWGGIFEGGTFRGGIFEGGTFHGGFFRDGTFHGGTFWGGIFEGGTFRGGFFRGGTFHGGTFWGGFFRDGIFLSSPACAQRSDGYMFVAKVVDGDLRVWAGCRNFSWDEAVAYWNDQHRHGAESQRIIHFLKAQAEAEAARAAQTE